MVWGLRNCGTSVSYTHLDVYKRQFKDGVATFTLKDGASKTATGLPAGTTYEVTEAEANQDG